MTALHVVLALWLMLLAWVVNDCIREAGRRQNQRSQDNSAMRRSLAVTNSTKRYFAS